MLSRGGGRVWNAQYRRVDSSRAFLVEYSTLGILVNNSGFWMSMEWFGRMQYSQVYEDRILVQYFGVVQCALQGRSISLSIAGCTRTAGAVLLDMT